MRFFQISYIPKGRKVFEIVGDMLRDPALAREVNEETKAGGVFITNVAVTESATEDSKDYKAKFSGKKKKLLGTKPIDTDLAIQVNSGDKYDSIVVSGEEEHKDLGDILARNMRRRIMPQTNALDNVIVVKSY